MCKFVIFSIFIFSLYQSSNCATRKSWKSAADFNDKVPNFTPFDNENEKLNEILTTEVHTSPSPSAETLTSKISSRIKMPAKYVAELNKINTQTLSSHNQDFGSFDFNSEDEKPEIDENIISDDQEEDQVEFLESNENNSTKYKVGQLVNVTVDSEENLINVKLDQGKIKEIFTGRGKKYNLLEKLVPLFIIPYLIQAAIVPFMITMIKLFLMKSLFAGKIAILFFLLGALKNHQNSIYMKSFAGQNAPFLLKDYPTPFLPERRIETSFDGYKVEGKPEALIN